MLVEHAHQGQRAGAPGVGLERPGDAGFGKMMDLLMTPPQRQGLPQGKVGREHGVEQTGIIAVPIKIEVAVNGPENLGAAHLRQAFQKQAVGQMLGLNDEVRGKSVLVQNFRHGSHAHPGRRKMQDRVPGFTQRIKQYQTVNQKYVHTLLHTLLYGRCHGAVTQRRWKR